MPLTTRPPVQRRKKLPNLIRVTGLPAQGPVLRPSGLTAKEGESIPFEISLGLQIIKPELFDFDAFAKSMLGQQLGITLQPSQNPRDAARYFHGEVAGLHLDDSVDHEGIPSVAIELRPSLWRLALTGDTRLFTKKTTRDIVMQILDGHGLAGQYQWHASPSCKPRVRPHCWQLHETDLEFVQRLLEEEGYIYWFTFSAQGHALHIADGSQWFATLGGEPLRLGVLGAKGDGRGRIGHWRQSLAAGPASCHVRGRSRDGESVLIGTATVTGPGRAGILYETDGLAGAVSECKAEAELRLAAQTARCHTAVGTSDVRALTVGMTLAFARRGQKQPDSYRVSAIWHEATQHTGHYVNHVEAVHAKTALAPVRRRHKPFLAGAYATVAEGPDAQGHYRLRFDLDRLQGLSAWIPLQRDTDLLFLPRIGQRVHVGFAENDSDRPAIVRVLNGPKIMPFDADQNPDLGGVFTPMHDLMINSDPRDPWIKLRAAGDLEDTTVGERVIATEKGRRETIGGEADWLVHKDANWSVRGSWLHETGKSHVIDAESLFLHGSQRIVLMVGSSYIVIDASGITINGKPLVHLNPPSGSAPTRPAKPQERVRHTAKAPKPRKTRR